MFHPHHFLRAALVATACLVATGAAAATIVDTGIDAANVGPVSANLALGPEQSLAAQFTIASDMQITDASGYFFNFSDGYTAPPTIGLAIYSNGVGLGGYGNDVPDSQLYQTSFSGPPGTSLDQFSSTEKGWYGASGLSWDLAAETYWLVFSESGASATTMPNQAINSADGYAHTYLGTWYNDVYDPGIANFGVRIDGIPSPVPLPATGIMMLAALAALAGLGVAKRRRRV